MALKPNLISRLSCLPDDFAFHRSVPGTVRPYVREQRQSWERSPADFVTVRGNHQRQMAKRYIAERRMPENLDQHLRNFVVPGPVQDHFLNVAAHLSDGDSRLALAQLALRGILTDDLKRRRLALFMEMFSRRSESYDLASQVRYLRDNFNNGHASTAYMLEHSIFELCADHPDIDSVGLRVELPAYNGEIDVMATFANGLKVYFEAKWANIDERQRRRLADQAIHDGAMLIYVRGFFGASLTETATKAPLTIPLAGLETIMQYRQSIIQRNFTEIDRARMGV